MTVLWDIHSGWWLHSPQREPFHELSLVTEENEAIIERSYQMHWWGPQVGITTQLGETFTTDLRCHPMPFLALGLAEISDLLRIHYSWTDRESWGQTGVAMRELNTAQDNLLWICSVLTFYNHEEKFWSAIQLCRTFKANTSPKPWFSEARKLWNAISKGPETAPHVWEPLRRNMKKKWHVWLSPTWASPRQLSYPVYIGMEAGGWTLSK